MNFGVWLPNCRHLATPDIIRGAAVRAEQLGYDSVWVSDHVVVPHANVVNFGETVFDPLVTLAVVAGATRRVGRATGNKPWLDDTGRALFRLLLGPAP